MIDKAIIRENFSNMLDGQLISVAKDDGHDLTPEAFQILKDEFSKRNLDYTLIELADQNKILIHQEKIQKVKDSVADDFLQALWKYILEEKDSGTDDREILLGLQERGLDEAHSVVMLSSLKDKLKEIVDQHDTKMLMGGVSFTIGTLITILTYTSAMSTGGYYFVAWGAILFGAIRFITGLADKGKHNRLLQKIEEKEGQDD